MHDPAAYDTRPLPPGPPRKDPTPSIPLNDPHRRQAEWQAHVDAGRIGARSAIPEDILANIEHNERVLKRVSPARG